MKNEMHGRSGHHDGSQECVQANRLIESIALRTTEYTPYPTL